MDKYHLRRAVLEALADFDPAPCTVDEIAQYPPIEMAGTERETLTRELRGLAAHGYIADLRPGRAPLYRLAAKGRDQLNRETDLDEYVWGEFASKFTG